MGRRKIEIQPITHERNRSVTFIKRKNGLFKKAYELGVLCSVDIAVIIFEERPGHQEKLYQYGSTDIRAIVQRHLRYTGERDTRYPSDFSGGAAATKADDIVDDDADDDADEDELRSSPAVKRTGDDKLKTEVGASSASSGMSTGDLPMPVDMDYQPHRPMAIPQPPIPMHLSGTMASSIPISGERLSSHSNSNKKQRLMSNTSVGISSSSRASSVDQHHYQSPSHGPPGSIRPLHHQQQQQNVPYPLFTPFQPGPHPLLMSSSFNFGYPTSPSSQPGQHNPSFPPQQPHAYQDNAQQQQAIYQQLLRHPKHLVGQAAHHQQPPGAHGAMTPDLFPPILEADEHLRQQAQASHGGFGAMNWPEHSQSEVEHREPDSVQAGGGAAAAAAAAAGGNTTEEITWLDFLSGATTGPPSSDPRATTTSATAAAAAVRSDSESTSWEPDHQDRSLSVEPAAVSGSSPSAIGNSRATATPPVGTNASVGGNSAGGGGGSSSDSGATEARMVGDNVVEGGGGYGNGAAENVGDGGSHAGADSTSE